jgi:environmental stress-induced protein Ves
VRWLPAADRAVSAWRNGGGFTREVAVFPAGSSLETFSWRLSIASIAADGPFSRFADTDRILAVISPGTLALRRADGQVVALDGSSPPYAFAGEEPLTGELRGAPVEDLNLMLRRSTYAGSLERLQLRAAQAIGGHEVETLAVALDPAAIGGRRMSRHDAAWLEAGETASLAPLSGAARVIIARIWRKSFLESGQRR